MAVYRFLGFELDTRTGELTRRHYRVRLRPQPSAVLTFLVERHGRFLSRQELHRAVWPEGTFVRFDDGLNSCMKQVRAALGDSRTTPRFIETLNRRGYRFIAPVVAMADADEPGGSHRVRLRLLPVRDLDATTPGPVADGLGEELLAHLAVAAPRDLAIVADGVLVGDARFDDATADYALATSVRAAGARVRATAQLIETRTRQHVWAGRFDLAAAESLDGQAALAEQIAEGVVAAIRDSHHEDLHAPFASGLATRL